MGGIAGAPGYKWFVDFVGLLRSPGPLAASLAAELVKINIQFLFFLFLPSSSVLSVSRFYFCESRLSSVALLPPAPPSD